MDKPGEFAYNPYRSFLLAASAGTGKTYQLSHRFLYLVASGADPSGILTITFTRKAAGEMRGRILELARDLLVNKDFAVNFERQLLQFYREAKKNNDQGFPLAPPISAQQVGNVILQASQRLKISTIDSLFMDWIKRFPLEAFEQGHAPDLGALRLATSEEKKLLVRQSENKALDKMLDVLEHDGLAEKLFRGDIQRIRRELQEVKNIRGYLWYILKSTGESGFRQHDISELPPYDNEQGLLDFLKPTIFTLSSTTKIHDDVQQAVGTGSIASLKETGFISREFCVSGRFIRGKKRESFQKEIDLIDSALLAFYNRQNLQVLNERTDMYEKFLLYLENSLHSLKMEQGIIDFDDLLRGAYQLFKGEHAFTPRYLIQRGIAHLMIDEFQDTSLLQWQVFENIAHELLAGDKDYGVMSGARPSVFLVGDIKQSIYGFREAEPRLMPYAAHQLAEFGLMTLGMQQSYRSSASVIKFVNAYFERFPLAGFSQHSVAMSEQGEALTPDVGSVTLLSKNAPSSANRSDEEENEIEKEADAVAHYVKWVLEGKGQRQISIPDKVTKKMRPLMPRDIAILYRSGTHAGIFESALAAKGIKTVRSDIKNFFNRPEITDFFALLKFLAFPEDLQSLCHLMRSPILRISEDQIFALLHAHHHLKGRERSLAVLEDILGSSPAAPWLKDKVSLTKINDVFSLIHEVFTLSFFKSGYQTSYPESEVQIALTHIRELHKVCVHELIDKNISDIKILARTLDLMRQDENLSYQLETAEAVRLMTIHASKGLEFGMVICVGLGLNWHKRDKYWLKGGENLDDLGVYYIGTQVDQPKGHFAFDQKLTLVDEKIREESDRLFYVALTRAIQHLVFFDSLPARGVSSAYSTQVKEVIEDLYSTHLKTIEIADDCSAHIALGSKSHAWEQEFDVENEKEFKAAEDTKAREKPVLKSPKNVLALTQKGIIHHSAGDQPGLRGSYIPRFPSLKTSSEKNSNVPLTLENTGEPAITSNSLAALYGTFIHAGLEAFVKDEAFNAFDVWQQLCAKENADGLGNLVNTEDIYQQALAEIEKVKVSDDFNLLLQNALRVEAELGVAGIIGENLWQGRIDLVCFLPGEDIVIIDYKTFNLKNFLPSDTLDAEGRINLTRFCKAKGYHLQLGHYEKLFQKIYPKSKVKKGILVTKLGVILYLD